MVTGYGGYPDSRSELTKIQELLYELRVHEIMTRPVITVTPDTPMRQAKELMRFRRISGVPVVEGDALAGIVSVEDVLHWLEQGASETPTAHWMTRRVYTVRSDEAAVQAINKFATHKIGRLPVVDREGKLVGIVTPGDVISQVLRILDALYREQETRRPRGGCTFDELMAEGAILVLRYDVAPRDFEMAGRAATKIKRVLDCIGLDPQIVRRAGISAFEAEMNLAIHADRGGKLLARIGPERLVIEAIDSGPGIEDLDAALTPGFTTAPDWIRELGFGAGMGLNNMRNCADQFSIVSERGKATVVRVCIDLGTRKKTGGKPTS